MLIDTEVACPYCGQRFTTLVDGSAGDQRYIEDCHVCCQPIVFVLRVDPMGNMVELEARRDDE